MYIPWIWLKKNLKCEDDSLDNIIEKLNYFGLECEILREKDEIFINFITYHNRKDLKYWLGILREIIILLKIENKEFFYKNNKILYSNNFNKEKKIIKIKTKKCSEYCLLIINNLNNFFSSNLLKNWLKKNKINSVNGIVDIGNFITILTGQPVNIFDLDKIKLNSINKISVYELKNNSLMIDIHGKERKLENGDIVVSKDKKIIELAGIIGEKETSVSNSTKNFLIEIANFDSNSIQNTSERINLKTKSSNFFSDNFNQENIEDVLIKLLDIIEETFGKKIEYNVFYFYKKKKKKKIIRLSHKYIENFLGIKISKEEISTSLKCLHFYFEEKKSIYIVEIPYYRKDIEIKEDIIEEIFKIIDYNLLPSKLPSINNEFIDKKINDKYSLKKKILNYLINSGYQEVITYSLVEEKKNNDFRVNFPKSSNHVSYRNDFIENHMKVIDDNIKQGNENIFIFEIGNTYFLSEEKKIIENEILSITAFGEIINLPTHSLKIINDIYWMKGLIENIFSIIDLSFSWKEELINNFEDKSLKINIENEIVGFLGRKTKKNDLKSDYFFIQLSIGKLLDISISKKDNFFTPISYLPVIKKDISFIIDKSINFENIKKIIKDKGGEFLINLEIIDIYEKNLPINKHSLLFRILFQGKEKNLRNKEIDKILKNILESLKERFSIIER